MNKNLVSKEQKVNNCVVMPINKHGKKCSPLIFHRKYRLIIYSLQ